MRILIVEDNARLADYLGRALKQQGYAVDCAYDGEAGEEAATFENYDLIILDILLPKKSGLMVCKHLRSQKVSTPILVLTARARVYDKVRALDIGADDYLIKPFELTELLARVRALLRRPDQKIPEILTVRTLHLNSSRTCATKDGQLIPLTRKEFALLEYLMVNKNRTLTREQILDHCWDHTYGGLSNIVDVYIRQVRRKIDDKHATYIKTIRGIGYQLQD